MITIKKIKDSIEKEMLYLESEKDKKKIKKSKDRIRYFRDVIKYIETSPTEEFIMREIDRLEKLIDSKITYAKSISTNRTHQNKILKSYDIPRIKIQLDTLKYILSR